MGSGGVASSRAEVAPEPERARLGVAAHGGADQVVRESPDALDDTPCSHHEQVQLAVIRQRRQPGAEEAGDEVAHVGDHGDGRLELDDPTVDGDAIGHGLDAGRQADGLQQVGDTVRRRALWSAGVVAIRRASNPMPQPMALMVRTGGAPAAGRS